MTPEGRPIALALTLEAYRSHPDFAAEHRGPVPSLLPSEPERAPLEAAERAAHLCEGLGHEVVEAAPAIDAHRFALDFARLIAVATATTLDELGELVGRSLRREDVELSTWMTAALGRELAAVEVEAARRRVAGLGQVLAELLTDCDVLLTPTLAQPPLPHGALRLPPALMAVEELIAGAHLTPVLRIGAVAERVTNRLYQFLPWTPLANVTGAPSMSLPLGMTPEGLPLGVMFTGRFGDEATLLQLAAQLEAAAPWSARRPAVFAG